MTFRTLINRSTFASTAAALGLMAGASACGDSPELSLSAPSTASQAVAQGLGVSPTNQTINEGGIATVSFDQVCVSSAADDVTISVDFADPNSNVADGNVETAVIAAPFAAQGGCDPGQFDACATPAGCPDLTHRYRDNNLGNAPFTIRAAAVQADNPTEAAQTLSVTVLNVAPVVTLNRTGSNFEGRNQTLSGTASDVGGLDTETAQVEWTFTLAGNVSDPTTVTVDCTVPAQAALEPLCNDNGGTANSAQERLFLQGPANYVTTLRVTDKDGASTTATNVSDIFNDPPQAVTSSVVNDSPAGNLPPVGSRPVALALSTDDTNPTVLAEGFQYQMIGAFTEAGIDTLDIDWNLILGDASSDRLDGSALVTKASIAAAGGNLANALTNVSGLTQAIIYNDDDGAVPNDVDNTVRLTITDNNGGSNRADRFIRIVDVDPVTTGIVITNEANQVASSVNEGSTLTFTATAQSGARDRNSDDPINRDRFQWLFSAAAAGGLPAVTDLDLSTNTGLLNSIEVVSGCGAGGAGVTEVGGIFTSTCTVRFLDDDLPAGRPAWQIAMRANDEDSSTTTAAVGITVNNVLPVVTALTLGGTVNEALVVLPPGSPIPATANTTATDPAGALDGDYTLTVTFGSALPEVRTATPAAGSLTFPELSRVYEDNDDCNPSDAQASCTVTAQVCETGGVLCSVIDPLIATKTQLVNNVAPTAAIVSPTDLQVIEEGTTFNLNGSMFDNGGAKDEDYAVVWTVETRQTSRTVTDFANRDTQMDASEKFQNNGPATISVQVTDKDTGTVNVSRNVIVDDNQPVLVGTPIIELDGANASDEAVSTATAQVSFLAQTDDDLISVVQVNWGDGSQECYIGPGITDQDSDGASTVTLEKGKGALGALPGRAAQCTRQGTPVEGYDDGRKLSGALNPYNVVVTVFDEDSSQSFAGVPANVQNVAPVLVSINPDPNPAPDPLVAGPIPVVIAEGTAAAFVLTVTDNSVTDQSAGLQALVDWDDGSTDITLEPFDGNRAGNDTIIRAAHVFTQIGAFDVQFTLRDKDGDTRIVRTITVEVVNLGPTLSDLFTTLPVTEGIEMSAVALVDNRGLDPLTYNFDFDCGVVNSEADIIAAFNGIPNNLGQTSGVAKNTYANQGDRTVCVRVCDDDNADNSCVFGSTTVEVFNQPSVLAVSANTPPGGLGEGGTVTLTASATDLGDDVIDFAVDCNNDGGIDDTELGVALGANAVFTCSYGDNGVFTARVIADDGVDVTERTVTINVNNVAPTLATTSATAAAQGAASTLTIAGAADASAADQASLVTQYDINNDGTFDLFSNAANGAASFRFPQLGANAYTARVCDKDGACSAAVNGTATVNNVAPTIQNVSAPAQVAIGAPVAVSVVATDAGNDTLNYTFSFAGVGPTQVVGPQASAVASASFAGTGTVTVTVTVSDGTASASADVDFNVVEGANENPSITLFSPPAPINEGQTVTLSANAVDAGNDTLTFTFDCEDDGVIDPANVVSGVTSGTASTTCSYANSGSFVARVTVSDADGGFTTQTTLVRVLNLAPVLGTIAATTVNEGQPTTLSVTGTTDAAGDTVTISYDTNGDGAFDITSDLANGAAQVSLPDGNTIISARACDNEGACSPAQNVTALVRNVAPVIQQISVPASAITGAPVSVNVTASDAGNDTLLFTFAFSNGGNLVQTIGPQPSPFATASFGESGSYTVAVTVTDTANAPEVAATTTDNDGFLVTDLNANIVAVAEPASILEGGSTTITVTPTTGVGPFDVSFDLNADGDFNDAVDVVNLRCDGNQASPCRTTATFAQNLAGNIAFRTLVSVTDKGNGDSISTAIVAIEVRNVAPTLNGGGNASVEEGTLFTRNLAGQQTDPGTEDTHTFSLVSGPAGLTVSGAGLISWTPGFADEGANPVVVRVTDSDGASGDASFTVTVTIIDTNNNGVSDTQERALNGGELLAGNANVTDTDNDGASDLDEVLAGTNPDESDAPRAPVVISPNGVSVATLTPVLTVANAFSPRGLELTYTFVVSDSTGTELVRIEDVEEGETTTSATVPSDVLTEQGSFTWVAFAKDGTRNLADDADIEGATSDTGAFTVDAENVAPAAPDALTPANDSAFLEGTFVTLEARAVVDADGDAVTYVFEVASDNAFGTIVATSEARAVPVFTLPEALAVGSYFWHAKASDGVLESAFGSTGTFSVTEVDNNEAPTPPGIVSPSNEAIASTQATLTITAGTDPDGDTLEYEFELADNAAFADPEASGAQAGLTFNVSDLDEDTQYFWRARSFDGALVSDWVNATFVVDAQDGAPAGLAILGPSDGALLLTAPTAFTATEAVDPEGDAVSYQVVVSESDDFASPIVNAAASVTNGVVRLAAPADLTANVEAGKTYFWKVTASDGTNDVVAAASFSLFKAEDPDPSVGGGGCNCSSNESNGSAGVFAAGLALLALRRRRRR